MLKVGLKTRDCEVNPSIKKTKTLAVEDMDVLSESDVKQTTTIPQISKQTSEPVKINSLPDEILLDICKLLSTTDIIQLRK
jgi:hypothetical protein